MAWSKGLRDLRVDCVWWDMVWGWGRVSSAQGGGRRLPVRPVSRHGCLLEPSGSGAGGGRVVPGLTNPSFRLSGELNVIGWQGEVSVALQCSGGGCSVVDCCRT